jgi:hypothetical protein
LRGVPIVGQFLHDLLDNLYCLIKERLLGLANKGTKEAPKPVFAPILVLETENPRFGFRGY